jgi:hypothetical protein
LDAKQAFQLAQHLGFSVALVDLDLKGKMACLSSSNCALISQTLRSSLLAASWVMTSSTPGTWALPRFCTSRLPPIGSRWSSGFESRESLEASGQYRIWWCRAYPTRGIGLRSRPYRSQVEVATNSRSGYRVPLTYQFLHMAAGGRLVNPVRFVGCHLFARNSSNSSTHSKRRPKNLLLPLTRKWSLQSKAALM